MNRIFLFLGTNIAILVVMSITFSLFGFEGLLDEQGVNLNLSALLIFSAMFGMGGSIISLLISKWMAKRATGAVVITNPVHEAEKWLLTTVERLAHDANIKTPEVAIFPSEDVNAFATGANKNKALVAVSVGIMEQMTHDELEAVLGHEISHIANGDMVTLTLIQGVVNTFVIFLSRVVGFLVDRIIFRTQRGFGIGYYITSIFAQIILGILASTIVMKFSRWREFKADAGGAKLAGKHKMISALKRLQKQQHPGALPEQLAAFGISGGLASGFKKLFLSHPPLAERIAALESRLD